MYFIKTLGRNIKKKIS